MQLRIAEKAFRPARFPFPLMHVDTGHNFVETMAFRVGSVEDSIARGRVVEEKGPRASRNRLQTMTLLDAIATHGFDCAISGARRDEERARAKERIFSHAMSSGSGIRATSAPSCGRSTTPDSPRRDDSTICAELTEELATLNTRTGRQSVDLETEYRDHSWNLRIDGLTRRR